MNTWSIPRSCRTPSGGEIVSIPDRLRKCSELDSCAGRRTNTPANLLCKSSTKRDETEVTTSGKARLCLSDECEGIMIVLLRPSSESSNLVTTKEHVMLSRYNRLLHEMGNSIGQHGVTYAPCTTIKTQSLTNFIIELTFPAKQGTSTGPPWELHMDGLFKQK